MPPIDPEFVAVVKALDAEGARFVIIGGLAMVLHGCAHVTEDLDLVYSRDRDNLAAIVRAIQPLHPSLRGAPEGLPFFFDEKTLRQGANWTLATDAGDVDLLADAGVGSFDEFWGRAVTIDLDGHAVRVASVSDLLLMKRHANREKDQRHILELEALQRLLNDTGTGEAPMEA